MDTRIDPLLSGKLLKYKNKYLIDSEPQEINEASKIKLYRLYDSYYKYI